MTVLPLPLAFSTNEDLRQSIPFADVEGAEDFDFTGGAFVMHIRKSAETLLINLTLSTANTRITIDDTNILGLAVPQEIVQAMLKPGKYVYDIVWTNVDGEKLNLAAGGVTVSLGVTRL